MTLRKDPKTGIYSADFRSSAAPRLHVTLGTTRKAAAMTRHEAVHALYKQGAAYPDLVERLRRRKLPVEAIEACVRNKQDFDTLRPQRVWPLLSVAIADYLAAIQANENRAARTHAAARSQLRRFQAFVHDGDALGTLRVDAVPTAAVEAYAVWMRAEGYKPNTVTDSVGRVGALYRWIQKREEREARESGRAVRLLHVPIDPETQPKDKPTRTRFLTQREAQALVAATPTALRFPVLAGLLGGLRLGEVLNLRPVDVDASRGLIRLRKRKAWTPKRGKERDVPMPAPLLAAYTAHLATLPEGAAYVTERPQGGRWRDATLRNEFLRIVTTAGMVAGQDTDDGVVFHTLRHTYASHLLMRGIDLYTVAQLLGDTLATVERTYAHLAIDHKRDAAATLATLLDGEAGSAVPNQAGMEKRTTSDTAGPADTTNPLTEMES